MLRYFSRKLLWSIPTVLLVAISVFALIRLIPGDPALLILGDRATPETLNAMRVQLGLDQSLIVQFSLWIGQAARGDLGHSVLTGDAVLPLILERFRVSIEIILPAVAIAGLVAVPLGTIAAWKQNSAIDLATVGGATLLLSIPTFWMGLLMLLFFGMKLGWFPVVGYVSIADDWLAGFLYLGMPIATLVIHEVGGIVRMARASTLEVLRLDYVAHARAKGLSEGQVLLHHVFRNAFGPTWTLLGLILGNLLGGVAIVETIFTIPGLGRLLVEAIFARDYPVIQGCLLCISLFYVAINLMIDFVYPAFDPRVVVS
ncbi:ABC transporter permease subunit [Agrobacterium vitis]|nr:ABC transporter permease subunit [Agrobacterium vitis]MCM2470841.1 ABC transporter permease [Agrobacterium vitis]MUO71209.1 ABC transporter permease subunit [Agrobacterium vitis]MUO84327.1 ABC transporter permease subunit [Agrobacterium vitis]